MIDDWTCGDVVCVSRNGSMLRFSWWTTTMRMEAVPGRTTMKPTKFEPLRVRVDFAAHTHGRTPKLLHGDEETKLV